MAVFLPAREILRKIAALRPAERRFAAAAWLLAPAVEISLAALGLRRTLAWIERFGPRSPWGATGIGAHDGAGLVDRAYRLHLLRGRCLPRALVQYGLHRRDGRPVRFVVGVKRGAAACPAPHEPLPIEAHAWVEDVAPGAADPSPARNGSFQPLLDRRYVPR
ncbi:MAG: lasso peptide biosynthesis B2 protein [Deltaproteobacteria bacterium]|nr:lasso peptide biosynthesis B2 protein [Deltaproteobacteria bacterium]